MTRASQNPGPVTRQPLPQPDSSTVQLINLGRVVLLDGESSVLLGSGKPLALLTYLRSIPGQSATRDHLIDLLWADSTPSLGRQALRQTLTRLRQALGDRAIKADRDEVALSAQIQQDRDSFLAAIERNDLPAALTLYTGRFFPDFGTAGSIRFEHWADAERAHLSGLFVRAGESLARRHIVNEPREALRIARLLHDQVPESESIARLMLQAALASGETLQAQSLADRLASWLTDAGRTPEPATIRLISLAREQVEVQEDTTGVPRLIADLVGREREFASVLAAWSTALHGGVQVLHFEARAGYGKTRLLKDAALRLRAMGVQVVQLWANPGEQEVAYCLAADAVRAMADLPGVTGVSPSFASALLGLHPPLITLFTGARPLPASADLSHQRMLALAELLSSVADERPLALFVDDLHWADPLSHQVLAGAVNRLGQAPILVVTAARPGEDSGPLVPAGRSTRLEPFSRIECASLVTSLAATPGADWTARMGDALWQASHGSPLLAMEALLLSMERADLQIRDGAWQSEDFEGAVERLGRGDPLSTRLDTLGGEELQTLLALAVAGSSLESEALATCLKAPESLNSVLSALETSGHIARSSGGWVIGHDEIGSAILERFDRGEQTAVARHLGRHLLSRAGNNISRLRRAGQLLAVGGDDEEIDAALVRLVRSARESGDSRPHTEIIAETVREPAGSPRVKKLKRALPIGLRMGIGPAQVAMGLSAAAVLLALLSLAPWGTNSPPPDAELLIVETSRDQETVFTKVPVWREKWDHTRPITPGSGGEKIVVATVEKLYNRIVMAPDGKRMAVTRLLPDSGLTDIFLRDEDGTMQRLTYASGDDVAPSWSPDGRYIVFTSMRWPHRGYKTFDLAILDLATGDVRQLTRGPDKDDIPYWSPDGTRIVFRRTREDLGYGGICWITFDARGGKCHYKTGVDYEVVGWHGSNSVIALKHVLSEDTRSLSVVEVDDFTVSDLHPRRTVGAISSADGEWILAAELSRNQQTLSVVAFPTSRPDLARKVPLTDLRRAAWSPAFDPPLAFIDELRLAIPVANPVTGLPHTVRLQATGVRGQPVGIPPAVLRWQVSDPRVARIDSLTGVLTPFREGKLTVSVSAGGWRSASVVLQIDSPTFSIIDSVRWTDSEWPEWEQFGDPAPILDSLANGDVVMMPHGDHTFESGVLSRRAYSVSGGLGVEALVSIPVNRPRWQDLKMSVGECKFSFPAQEGRQYIDHLSMSRVLGPAAQHPALGDGAWHALAIEVLPDGSCSYGVDGELMGRSAPIFHSTDSVQIRFAGHSVGTRIMVNDVNIWRGVRVAGAPPQ